jgi:hypothetical protein
MFPAEDHQYDRAYDDEFRQASKAHLGQYESDGVSAALKKE